MSSFVKLPAPSPNSWRYIQSCRWRQQKPSDKAGSSLRHRIRQMKKERPSACSWTNSQAEGLLIGWCCSQQQPDFNQILTLPDGLRKPQALDKTLVYKNQICLPFLDKVCFWESSYSILLFLKMPCEVKKNQFKVNMPPKFYKKWSKTITYIHKLFCTCRYQFQGPITYLFELLLRKI